MNRKDKIKIFKIILTIFAISIIIGAIAYLLPVMKNLSTIEGQVTFKEKVNSSGLLGLLILFGLQVAQIFLFIIPGEPIEIVAGMCYGGIWGTIFIMLSSCIISMTIFMLVRKFGRKFVYDFCDKKNIQKIENSKLFKNPKKVELIIFLLFFIPGTPKDLLVYVCGLLPIKPSTFILISTFARFPSVITSTLAGAHLIVGNWKMSIILYIAIISIVLICIFIMNKFDKSKTTEKIIKNITNSK